MSRRNAEGKPPDADSGTRVVAAAGSFTSLWALTWLASGALGATAAVQGGFAVGGVMAGSGLTVLWWKARALRAIRDEAEIAEREEAGEPEPETRLAE